MAVVKKVEMQDSDGNIIHPHTEAAVVFLGDGSTLEEALKKDVSEAEIKAIFNNNRYGEKTWT